MYRALSEGTVAAQEGVSGAAARVAKATGLQQLHVALTPLIILCRIPFRVAVALTGTPWTDFVDLLPPPDTPWVPPEENDFGEFFLKVDKRGEIGMPYLCKDLLEIAQTAQVPLAAMRLLVRHLDDFHLSLLDCAILFGQSDCAALLATEGVELSHEGSKLLLQFGVLDAEPARWPAAMAAAHAALSKVWKSEIAAKGIAIYQLMKKLSKGRPFPASLVDEVAAFSMDVPKIIEDLDLCQEASAWYKSSQVSPVSPVPPKAEKISVHPEDVKFSRGSREPDATSQSQRDRDAEAVDEKAMDALMMAMRESRGDVPALNVDGVRLFRLTRMANANHVVDLLFDRLGPLKALHDRVQEAGCSVNPEDNPLKILYVPCTEEQLLELQQLAADGFELRKDLHILALQEDAKLINQAFRELFQRLHVPRNCRPELKPEGPQHKDVGAERGLKSAKRFPTSALSGDSVRFARNHDTVMNPGLYYGLGGSCVEAMGLWAWLLALHDGSECGSMICRALRFRNQLRAATSSEVCLRYERGASARPALLLVVLRGPRLLGAAVVNLRGEPVEVPSLPLEPGITGTFRPESGELLELDDTGRFLKPLVVPGRDAQFLVAV
eukprot:g27286.t1